MSHDINYVKPFKKRSVEVCDDADVFTEQSVFLCWIASWKLYLDLNGLPFWYLRLAAASISASLQYLFNQCLRQSFVPKYWKTARITPVPKVSKPAACQDYCPISVTPILSRLFEKVIVLREFFYILLVHDSCRELYGDQYAFRSTGSITAALINLSLSLSLYIYIYIYIYIEREREREREIY